MIYSFVPKMIKYYLDEEIIIKNVETYICHYQKDREYVSRKIYQKLVVKSVAESWWLWNVNWPLTQQRVR